ncbi:MAG: metal ABC transporter substrate-binding protein [Spirochaetaceae bacterium]|jgi:zinc transport system substrate-binding protein|nr:metal ABC transporter substrate-binding protein [Spirochaetaceae bacterium]
MKYILSVLTILFLSACALFAGGKKDPSGTEHTKKPEAAAVNFPAYDFVRQIAGGRVEVFMLLPPGAESHSFEPTPRDIIKIQNSALFVYNGGESDAWVDRILASMDKPKDRVIRMMDAVEPVEEEIVEGMEHEEEGEEAAYDEHIWTSPKNAVRIVEAVAEGLCRIDPAGEALFRQNARRYCAELEALDREFQAVVDGAKRKTLVFGDRFPFRYFADAYGLGYSAAFPGCSTESDCSAATLAFLINKIKAEQIPVVFHIELSNENIADAIAAETGAKKRLFHAGHTISKRDFDQGLTFLAIQRANVPRLKEALW